jgi:hypothetical protein
MNGTVYEINSLVGFFTDALTKDARDPSAALRAGFSLRLKNGFGDAARRDD